MTSKLLFVAPSSPFPPQDGKRQRTLAFLLATLQDYTVDYLALDGHPGNELFYIPDGFRDRFRFISLSLCKDPKWLKKLGLSFFPNAGNQKLFSDLLESSPYDRIFCRYTSSARDLPSNCNFILDVDDDYEELMRTNIFSQTSFLKKIRFRQILFLNSFYNKRILKNAKKLIWVKDQKKSGHILPNLPFQILLSGVEDLTPPRSKNLLFVGKLSYEPNANGIRWFLEKVWPILNQMISGIELTIISPIQPNTNLLCLINNCEGVHLKINVSDIQKQYMNHSVCIVPIFSGGGSNVKLPEALLMGRKVVTTKFGARGFENWIKSGQVNQANSPQEWVKKITEALNEPWEKDSWNEVRCQLSLKSWNQKFLNILNGP